MKKSLRVLMSFLICIALILPVCVSASEESLDFSSAASKVEYPTLGMISTEQLKNAKLSENDVPEALLVRNTDTSNFVHRVRSLEDEYSLVYQNIDGTNTMLQFASPVQYRDAEGNLKDKSTKTELINGQHVTTENDVKVSIPQNLEKGVSLEFDGYAIAMKPVGMLLTIGSVAKMDTELKTAADTSVYKYSGLYDANTDIVYSPSFSGVKCDIVLKQYTGKSEFEFAVLLKGLHLEKNNDEKIIYLLNSDNEKVAYFNTVTSYDSSGKVSFGDMDLEQLGEGQYIVTLKVDEGFLTDEETVYPVTVDPSTTFVNTNDPDVKFEYLALYLNGTSYHSSSYMIEDLIVGSHRDKFKGRVLYKFSDMSKVALMKSISKIELVQCVRTTGDLYSTYAYAYKGSPWTASSTFESAANGYDLSYKMPIKYGEKYGTYTKYMRIDITNFYNTCKTSSVYSLEKGIELYNKDGEDCLEFNAYDSFFEITTNDTVASPDVACFAPYVYITYEPYKIMLDAGHFKNQNPITFTYNGTQQTYVEGNQMWKLQTYLKSELSSLGYYVETTRTDNSKDLAVVERGKKASGHDLFLSLHSNASSSTSTNKIVVIYDINNKNNAFVHGQTIANAVMNSMKSGGLNITDTWMYQRALSNDPNQNWYGVLRGAASTDCPWYYIIEHSFHTNPAAAAWLNTDSNLRKLAEAEAQAIYSFLR